MKEDTMHQCNSSIYNYCTVCSSFHIPVIHLWAIIISTQALTRVWVLTQDTTVYALNMQVLIQVHCNLKSQVCKIIMLECKADCTSATVSRTSVSANTRELAWHA